MTDVMLFTVILVLSVAAYIAAGRRHKRLTTEQTANNRFWTDLEEYEYEEEVLSAVHALVNKEAELAKNPFPEPIPEIPEARPERSIKV